MEPTREIFTDPRLDPMAVEEPYYEPDPYTPMIERVREVGLFAELSERTLSPDAELREWRVSAAIERELDDMRVNGLGCGT